MQNSFSSTITRNNFRNPQSNVKFTQNSCDPKSLELLRLALISELEGITNYDNYAMQITNEGAKKVLQEIRNEERVHAGELLTLIQMLCPEETNFYNLGKDEVTKIIENNTMNFR